MFSPASPPSGKFTICQILFSQVSFFWLNVMFVPENKFLSWISYQLSQSPLQWSNFYLLLSKTLHFPLSQKVILSQVRSLAGNLNSTWKVWQGLKLCYPKYMASITGRHTTCKCSIGYKFVNVSVTRFSKCKMIFLKYLEKTRDH